MRASQDRDKGSKRTRGLIVALLLASTICLAQSTQTAPGPIVAVYGSFQPSTQPRPTGGTIYITAPTSGGLFTGIDTNVYLSGKQLVTSTGSIGGLALKSQYGGNAYLLGTFGGATAQTGSTSATGYSISGGFALDRPKFKSKWLNLLLPKWGGLVALKSNTTQTVTTEIRLAWRVSK